MLPIKEGNVAPDFLLLSDEGKKVRLSDFRGRRVVLYFYPADDTPGCIKEGCGFRDDFRHFHKTGAVILGISPDDVASHQKFKAKYHFPFPLLADSDHKVAEKYGVWVEKNAYGRKYWGVARTTFLIDEEGRIARIFQRVKPEGHSQEVLEALAAQREEV